MATTTRAEIMRRVGAAVVAMVALGIAATQYVDGTGALLGDGLRAMLGEGDVSTVGDTLRVMLADALPALTVTLGLVPAAALVLAAASRPERPSSRAAAGVVALAVAGVVLLVVGVLALTADPTTVRLATRSWFFAVGSPRMLAGLWLAIMAAGVSTASAGVLLRRRGAVVCGATVVAVGALAAAVSAGGSLALTVWSARHYLAGPPLDAVLTDGRLAAGFVATTAAVVAGWCAVAAWRRLGSWVLPPADTSPEALVARTRRRRFVAAGTVGALVVVVGVTVATRVTVRELVPDVVADPALAACVERSLGAAEGGAIAPERFDEVYVIDCPWRGEGDRVTSLAGIERLGSVHTIDLTGQDVSDLGPLASLTGLISLRLTSNAGVADLTALGGLPLTNLGLSDTGVADLAPLAGTTSLQFVGLAGTAVSDVGPLAASTGLIELDLADAAVADLSALAGAASLSKLDVRGNRVADLTPVATMPALDELWVGGNPVTDLRPLLDASALLGVDVEGLDGQTPGIEELRAQGVYVGGLA